MAAEVDGSEAAAPGLPGQVLVQMMVTAALTMKVLVMSTTTKMVMKTMMTTMKKMPLPGLLVPAENHLCGTMLI